MTLTWGAPNDDTVTGYRVLRRKLDESAFKVHVEDTGGTATTHVDTVDVEPGTTYVYEVKAINGSGAGAASEPVQVTTDPSP